MANTFTNFFPTRWSDVAYFVFANAAIAPQVTNLSWVDPGGPAEAIRIPKFSFSTSVIENVDSLVDTPNNISESTLVLNLDKNKGFHFQVRYSEQDKANVSLGEALLRQHTAALAAVIDQDVFGLVTGASNTLSGAGAVVGRATLVSAIELLNEANAPQTDRVLVVNPDSYSDLLNISDFVRADSIAGATINQTGLIGQVLGLDVFLSNNLPATSADAVVMHRAALAMAMLRTIDVRVFDQPRHFAVGYTGRAIYGEELVDADLMVTIRRT